jgi:hypothetical protein
MLAPHSRRIDELFVVWHATYGEFTRLMKTQPVVVREGKLTDPHNEVSISSGAAAKNNFPVNLPRPGGPLAMKLQSNHVSASKHLLFAICSLIISTCLH